MKTPVLLPIKMGLLGLVMLTPLFADVEIRTSLFLSAQNRAVAAALIKNHPEAKKTWDQVAKEADGVLKNSPRPQEKLSYEGILGTKPSRIETEDRLRDMDMLALVTQAYSGNPKPEYLDFIKRFVKAWATTYKPTGNAINENKLEAIFCGYYLSRDSFPSADRTAIEAWMIDIAKKIDERKSTDNWESKRFKILGEISLATGKKEYMDKAVERYRNFMRRALRGDGSSEDFHGRKALHYHGGGLRPLLVFTLIAEQMKIRVDGKSMYEWEASNGASVKKSVHFYDPYLSGEKKHLEFQGSGVDFDEDRCNAGLKEYCPHYWEPSKDYDIFELAAAFEPDYAAGVVAKIVKSDAKLYPTYLTVLTRSTTLEMGEAVSNRKNSFTQHLSSIRDGLNWNGNKYDIKGTRSRKQIRGGHL